jgi:uncharacterized HAD superfamily protein
VISLDIDGVVADSYSLIRTAIRYSYGLNIDRIVNSYHIRIPDIPINIGGLFEDLILSHSNAIEPYPEAIKACHLLLNNIDYPIIFLTARRISGLENTKRWLKEKLLLPKDSFSVIIKESDKKSDYLKKAGISCFIEDRLRTVNQLSDLESMNKIYLINRRWNIGRETRDKIIRKNNLLECIIDYLKGDMR